MVENKLWYRGWGREGTKISADLARSGIVAAEKNAMNPVRTA
jgi:hypothetical protein